MFYPILACFALFSLIPQIFSVPGHYRGHYYWREYSGFVPSDAFSAGKDLNGNDVYIGQAYVGDEGLIVVGIYPGVKHVYAEIRGIHRIDKYIKILCAPESELYWMPVNASALHLILTEKYPVIGGHEDGQGYYYIGKTTLRGETRVGKIDGFILENAKFFFEYNNTTRSEPFYQVLLSKRCPCQQGWGIFRTM